MHYYNKVLLGGCWGGGVVCPQSEIQKMWSFRILMSRPCPCTSVFNLPLYELLYKAIILGDPGADSAGGEGKSKRAENMA